MKKTPKSPFNSFVYLDYLQVKCPCGAETEGEGTVIHKFFKAHKKHTNGKCVENIMGESYRVLSADTPSQRTYKVK